MSTLKDVLAENLKRLLKEKKVSQSELANQLKVSFQTVNSIMNARGGTTWSMISEIARVLKIDETELFSPDKKEDKIELKKSEWQEIHKVLTQLSTSMTIPSFIIEQLSHLDESKRQKLFKTWEDQLKNILSE